ncbi:MAG: AAA family ATPase [Polyangiales bacterium]
METHSRTPNAPADTLSPTTVSLRRRKVFVHQSVIDWIHDPRSDRQLTQRARLVLWQMFAQGAPTQIKSVRGAGRGWLRSDLGGNHGHQFYLWWSRAGSIPLKALPLDRGDVLVREVRHHDRTDEALEAGTHADWLPLDAVDLDGFDLSPVLLPSQQAALAPKGRARMIRGQPGTGKTTVLARAALQGGAQRVLYLTYSDRLAVRAREYFREFAPPGATVRVSTFRELFRALGDAWTPTDPLPDDDHDSEVRQLERALTKFPHRYAPWEGKCEALHAELHAYFAGASLPEAFRDSPACPEEGFSVEDYVALRKAAIGEKAATVAAKVGRFLLERDALREIAPGPWQARKLLDALRGDVALPASLADVRSIFVDEVQDLTRVEAALLLDVAAAIGRARGASVELVVAGDEGQTVRPTDFDWGVLADLIARRFDAPESFDLASNVRSPSALVSVVNSTWELYQRLSKDRRPRGRATVEIEESVSGRVVRCRVRDDAELARLATAFSELPRAAFVHAGTRAPEGFLFGDVETFGSATAKGLDFSVVAVIGAGRHIADAHAHVAHGVAEAFHTAFARPMIDQLRVAVSRASDTLVFVDREGDAGGAEIDRLVRGPDGGHAEGFLGEMSVDELISLLDRSDATAEELVNEFLVDVRGALEERPRWALERARRARGLLGRSDSKVGVSDLTLRAEAMRLHGVAALRLAVSDDASDGERRDLFVESNRALHAAKHGDAGTSALWIRDLREKPVESGAFARRLIEVLPSLDESVPEWRRCVREELARWCRRCATLDLPDGARAMVELVESVESISASLDGDGGSLAPEVEQLRVRAAEALCDTKRPDDALRLLSRSVTHSPLLEARCHEARFDFTRAMERYEQAGALRDALRCARNVPDLGRAFALAEGIEAQEVGTLRRMRDVTAALDQIAPDALNLTDAEFTRLKHVFDGLASARKPGRTKGP